MAAQKKTKKKTKKKSTKAKKATSKRAMSTKKMNRPKKLRTKKLQAKTATAQKTSPKKQARKPSKRLSAPSHPSERRGSRSGEQSGDLQGLSHREMADSESVDELLEEGNAFEADAVMGVQNADNTEGEEVHTHEVPEDDVPDEYLDKD